MSGAGLPKTHPSLLADTLLADLEIAWQERDCEAEVLRVAGHFSTSLALRIYSLEIRVKTKICERLNLTELPVVCKTHDLSVLIIFTGLWTELNEIHHLSIRQSWDLLVAYSKKPLNEARYLPRSSLTLNDHTNLLSALDDSNDGVIAWLSKPR